MQYLSIILAVALIHLLAVISPGPDFIMILRNSLKYGRQSGIYSAVGLGLGILLHITYCLAGIAIIISQSILVFTILKYIGAAYLIYIGIKTLKARPSKTNMDVDEKKDKPLTQTQAIRIGFITNATNPKATLFCLSLFTLVIQPSTPMWVKLIMSAEMSIATVGWFTLLAIAVSHRVIRGRISKVQHYAERFIGGILILFGLKLASTHSK